MATHFCIPVPTIANAVIRSTVAHLTVTQTLAYATPFVVMKHAHGMKIVPQTFAITAYVQLMEERKDVNAVIVLDVLLVIYAPNYLRVATADTVTQLFAMYQVATHGCMDVHRTINVQMSIMSVSNADQIRCIRFVFARAMAFHVFKMRIVVQTIATMVLVHLAVLKVASANFRTLRSLCPWVYMSAMGGKPLQRYGILRCCHTLM